MISSSESPQITAEGVRKREALARLLERYDEARAFGSAAEPYADLEWVLGSKRDPRRQATDLDTNMIELIALWLQDLVTDVERRPGSPDERPYGLDESLTPANQARRSAARNLRVATESFVVAFRAAKVTK